MRAAIFRIIAVVAFCWAVLALLSLFSELKLLLDGLSWSVNHLPPALKAILLEIGKRTLQVVSMYRDLLHGSARLLHLPVLADTRYDVIGLVAISIVRGTWLWEGERRAALAELAAHQRAQDAEFWSSQEEREESERFVRFLERVKRRRPLMFLSMRLGGRLAEIGVPAFVAVILVYPLALAVTLVVLFGIDFGYRHFG